MHLCGPLVVLFLSILTSGQEQIEPPRDFSSQNEVIRQRYPNRGQSYADPAAVFRNPNNGYSQANPGFSQGNNGYPQQSQGNSRYPQSQANNGYPQNGAFPYEPYPTTNNSRSNVIVTRRTTTVRTTTTTTQATARPGAKPSRSPFEDPNRYRVPQTRQQSDQVRFVNGRPYR